ncbi:guanylate kinase [Verticillium alfalfae VaMs.102]|uniref:Guanylate kinase n=1 Tax=Verticillium alfalfae (strain VaMs.102 / ATCC MYA-4576 / FGSC 10136) TaxID=526221 RepID=C9SB13_VERA1|nr:guanylate kinase [Verticillium alfalfae VaMs.102]EEY16373.1 guanylate kinase [Verticillium alfalfae VaMs.102]
MPPGQTIVISGPSGVGKGTLIQKLQDTHRGLFTLTVSHTTRSPRPGEVDGVNYYFVSRAQFSALIAQNGFIEHTTFSGAMYGTSKRAIIDQAAKGLIQGTVVLLEIDQEGIKQLKQSPYIPAALQGRVDYADTTPGLHDLVIVNDNIEKAYKELEEFIFR